MKGLVNCNFLPGSARRLELGTVSAEPLSRAYWSQNSGRSAKRLACRARVLLAAGQAMSHSDANCAKPRTGFRSSKLRHTCSDHCGRPAIGHRSAPRDRIARRECQAGLHRGIPASGFTVELLAEMVRAGLATAQIERARAGGQTRVHITNAGRRALREKRAVGQWKSHAITARRSSGNPRS